MSLWFSFRFRVKRALFDCRGGALLFLLNEYQPEPQKRYPKKPPLSSCLLIQLILKTPARSWHMKSRQLTIGRHIVLILTSDQARLAVDTFGGIDNDSVFFRFTFSRQCVP